MDFQDVVPCKNKSVWTNTCDYIIIHHTGWGSYASNLRILSGVWSKVSCHFLVGSDWQLARIWDPREIQWHAGKSQRGNKTNINRFSIGIEIVDDPTKWDWFDRFTDKQRVKVRELVEYLMKTYNIKNENVLTHASVTRDGSKEKKLWDWTSKARKVDANRSLWVFGWHNTFQDYRASLLRKKTPVVTTNSLIFAEIIKANSAWWHLWDAEDRKRLSEMNDYLRAKYF